MQTPSDMELTRRLADVKPFWLPDGLDFPHVILASDVMIRRNVAGEPFLPEKEDTGAAQRILDKLENALAHVNEQNIQAGKAPFELKVCDGNLGRETVLSMENRWIPARDFFSALHPKAMFATQDLRSLLYFNGSNHYSLFTRRKGLEVRTLTQDALQITNAFEQETPFLKNPHYGYVNREVSNLGGGWKARVILHLPAMILTGHKKHLDNFLAEQGIAAKMVFHDQKEPMIYLAHCTINAYPGVDPEEQAVKMERVMNQLEQHELDARALLRKDGQGLYLENLVRRSAALLRGAKLMTSEELLHILSLLWLGHELDILPLPTDPTVFFNAYCEAFVSLLQEKKHLDKPSVTADFDRIHHVRRQFGIESDF